MDEYCFTPLSAKSWQYRDRKKPKVGTMPHSYRMISRVFDSLQYMYNREHYTLQSLEQVEALYIFNPMTTIRRGRDSSPVPSFEPQPQLSD